MKKAVMPLVIVIVLIFATMILDINVAKANPTYPPMPPTPDLNQPTITIQTPEQNKIYNVNSVPYSITVKKPSSWFDEYPVHGQILIIDYILDGSQHVEIGDEPDYYKQGPFSFTGTLSGLPEGNHSLEVYVRSDSFYDPSNATQPPYPPPHDYYLDTYSDKINFTVDTVAPSISFLVVSGENATYPLGDVPLGFVVSEPSSKLAYCLDEGDNVTVAGNFTLTGVPNGLHTLTVYAWDIAGNIGTSKTISFTVDTQESESQPEPFPWLSAAAVSVAVAAVVAVATVAYLKKRGASGAGVVKNP